MHTETTEWIPLELIALFEESLRDDLNRLPHNYLAESLSSEENVCYSITYDDEGDPISGSVARKREIYNDGVRLLSRYYTSKKLSAGRKGLRIHKYHIKGMSTFAVEQADQQIEFCKNTNGTEKFFISREYKNPSSIRNLCRGMEYHSKFKGWTLEEDLWRTAPCDDDSCWQRIVWLGGNPLNDKKTFY